MPEFPHRDTPCANCPVRRDSPAGEFPPERYVALRATAGTAGNEVGLNAPIFACHKSSDGNPMACAGWLAQFGYEHLGIRLAVATGRLPAESLQPRPGWPPLFDTYDEMAARNGVCECGAVEGDCPACTGAV
jgi:hypothetical protein